MSTLTVEAVSNYIINDLTSVGEAVTNLRLQKLLYYAQAWHLVNFGAPLFPNRIEAWIHGPVVVDEYRRFKSFGSAPIPEQEASEISEVVQNHLDRVLVTYGVKTPYELELLTHREAPWLLARGEFDPTESCSNEITLASMQDFYTRMKREHEEKKTRELTR